MKFIRVCFTVVFASTFATSPAWCDPTSGKGKLQRGLFNRSSDTEVQLVENPAALFNRANAKERAGNLNGALADYNQAILLLPTFAEAFHNRGFVKSKQGDVDGALADYDRAIELKPEDALPHLSRALVNKSKGNLTAALADCTRAIELNPKFSDAYRTRAYLHYNQRAFPEARADFRHATELISSDIYVRFSLWLSTARLGEEETATKNLKTFLRAPELRDAGDWQLKLGRFLIGDLSEQSLFKASENRDSALAAEQRCEAYFYAGTKRLLAGNKSAAADYFEKCVATGNQNLPEYQCAAAELAFLKSNR